MFGQYGTTLSLLSLFYLTKKDKDFKKNIFYIFGFILGFMGVFVSASKSPLLALILVSLLFLFLWYGSVKSLLLLLTLGIIIYVFFADILFFLNDIFKSSLIERILYAIEVGGDKTREKYFATAFNEFIDNPIFGNAMLIQEYSISGNYPHNLILEALMSIGFMGGITIMLWIAKCIRGFYLNCKKHSANTWISLLFMQYLVFSMFSGNIFSNNLFWIFSVLVIGVNYKSITNEKYKRDNV
nr:O-antigen ligase family protein [Mesonia hippocampi]